MRRLAAVVCALLALAIPLQGQESGLAGGESILVLPDDAAEAPSYGTVAQSSLTASALDFVPVHGMVEYATFNAGGVFRFQPSGPSVEWWKSVSLPNGAIIESLQMHACDDSIMGQIQFGLAQFVLPGQTGSNVTPIGSTGTAGVPGCALFSVTPNSPPLVVDNANNTYAIFMGFEGDFGSVVKVGSFRVFYRLQVSPSPGAATFSDVPTDHSFFRFVEALAAAGITGGCGGGNYCPNSPVTRGQMAVFLSIALGLHFPN